MALQQRPQREKTQGDYELVAAVQALCVMTFGTSMLLGHSRLLSMPSYSLALLLLLCFVELAVPKCSIYFRSELRFSTDDSQKRTIRSTFIPHYYPPLCPLMHGQCDEAVKVRA